MVKCRPHESRESPQGFPHLTCLFTLQLPSPPGHEFAYEPVQLAPNYERKHFVPERLGGSPGWLGPAGDDLRSELEQGPLDELMLGAMKASAPAVYQMIGDAGLWFVAAPRRPRGLRKRQDGACFFNAAAVVFDQRWPDLVYCEGLAPLDEEAVTDGPWLHHAWCATKEGEAIEVTWRLPAAVYYGVVIDSQVLAAAFQGSFGGVLPTPGWRQRVPPLDAQDPQT